MSNKDSPSDAPVSSSTPPTEDSNRQLDRPALIEKAQAFLLSPDVHHENEAAKRRFLEEKGLTGEEIDVLIRELPSQPPPVPPRTYPPPPPSNLPFLLASIFRAFTWIGGISGVLLLGYYRFLLPRLTRSLGARHRLKLHQAELMGRLQGRIDELKGTQAEVYDNLPRPDDESLPVDIKTLADLPINSAGEPTRSLGVVVRLTFFGVPERKLTLEELYRRVVDQFPGLKEKDGEEYKRLLSRELSRPESYDKTQDGDLEYWSLRRDIGSSSPSASTPIDSLKDLGDAVSRGHRVTNKYQHTFKSLTDLTAFLSRETYTLHGAGSGFRYGFQGGHHPLSPAEEDVRREIRALKGLVLNRAEDVPSLPVPIDPLQVQQSSPRAESLCVHRLQVSDNDNALKQSASSISMLVAQLPVPAVLQ